MGSRATAPRRQLRQPASPAPPRPRKRAAKPHDNPTGAWCAASRRPADLNDALTEFQRLELEASARRAARYAVSFQLVPTSPGSGLWLLSRPPVAARFREPVVPGEIPRGPFRLHECGVKFRLIPTVDSPDVRPRDSRYEPCLAPHWLRAGGRDLYAAWDQRAESIASDLDIGRDRLLPDGSVPLLERVGERDAADKGPLLRIEDDPYLGAALGTSTIYVLADRAALRAGRIEGLASAFVGA